MFYHGGPSSGDAHVGSAADYTAAVSQLRAELARRRSSTSQFMLADIGRCAAGGHLRTRQRQRRRRRRRHSESSTESPPAQPTPHVEPDHSPVIRVISDDHLLSVPVPSSLQVLSSVPSPNSTLVAEQRAAAAPLVVGASFSQRIVLNVGGVRHEVPWRTLARLPRTRLGRLVACRSHAELESVCDDFDLSPPTPEFFFDRHPRSFFSVVDFHRTGKLHMVDETACVLAFSDDLAYWAIDELYMEPCCQQRYQQRKEQVLEVLKKELEDLTLGDETDTEVELHHSTLPDAADEHCIVQWRRRVWDLTEKPQSSLPARVSRPTNQVLISTVRPNTNILLFLITEYECKYRLSIERTTENLKKIKCSEKNVGLM